MLIFAACLVDGLILISMTVYFVSSERLLWLFIDLLANWCWFVSLTHDCVFQIICLSDLECDYLNNRQGCKRLNQVEPERERERVCVCVCVFHSIPLPCPPSSTKPFLQWVLPELVAACFIPIVLLLSLHWILFIFTCPVAGYLIHR